MRVILGFGKFVPRHHQRFLLVCAISRLCALPHRRVFCGCLFLMPLPQKRPAGFRDLTRAETSAGKRLFQHQDTVNGIITMDLSTPKAAVKADEVLRQATTSKHASVSLRWYAAYTFPRHEKAVADRLRNIEIEAYLPLYGAVHCWNHRRVKVELPLFPGYVFVRMNILDKAQILGHPGVIRMVDFNGKAAVLPDDEIRQLRTALAMYKAEPYPFLTAGKRVRIKSGPLVGLEGIIIRRKGTVRLIVLINLIRRAIRFELDAADAQLAN
jgi:transcription antitermination factor NusG